MAIVARNKMGQRRRSESCEPQSPIFISASSPRGC
jgi:hypothetical protein